MQVIEFNGLPGCGKSTLCSKILEELSTRTLSIGNLQDVIFRKQKSKLDNYFWLIKTLISFSNMKFNLAVLKFASDYKLDKSRLLYSMRLIKLNSKLKSIIKNNHYDLLLLEEGIIQYITSIPHDKPIIVNNHFQNLCDIIREHYEIHIQVDCNINNSDNISRIKNRNNLNNRYDRLPLNQLQALLSIKENNILIVRNRLNNGKKVGINMQDDLNENVNYLIKMIDEII